MSEEEMKALVEMNNMLQHENGKLKQELQFYKDKLEEIREYVEHNDFSDWHIGQDKDQFRKNDILQILNEGDK